MNATCRKEVIDQIRTMLLRPFPNLVDARCSGSGAGVKAWRIARRLDLNFFVIPVFSSRFDEFCLELAWSGSDEVPDIPDTDPVAGKNLPAARFRCSRIWQPLGWEVWYSLAFDRDEDRLSGFAPPFPDLNVLMSRVPAKAAKAFDDFERWVVPYMESVK